MSRFAHLIPLLALVVVPTGIGADPPQVAFTEVGAGSAIVRLDQSGAGVVELTRGKPEPLAFDAFSWSPDGARLVYAGAGLVGGNLHAIDANGGSLAQLTTGAGNQAPAWSPDGTKVAYIHIVRTRLPSSLYRLDGDIWLVDADGRNPRRLTRNGGQKYAPQWSPDSSRILYSGTGTSIVDVRSGRVLLHTTDAGGTWSPDGARIAVQSPRGIDVISADGTGRRTVAAAAATSPRWSPDGSQIAFERSHCTPGLKGLCGLILHSVYTVGADGRGERRLTGPISTGPDARVDGFPNDDTRKPAWWPDGARLFVERRGYAYAVNADGACERPFGPGDRQLRAPLWRPGAKPAASPLRCVELRLRAVAARNPVGLRGHARVHVTVENDGNETATATRLTLRRVYGGGRIVPPLSSCRGASPVVCGLAPLAARAARRLVVDVADRTSVGFRLQATVTAAEADSDPSTNSSIAFVNVLDCDIVGTAQSDKLVGTAVRDKICGLQGNDLIRAGAGDDTIIGGAGSDRIECGPGRDAVVVTGRIDTVARDCERVVRG